MSGDENINRILSIQSKLPAQQKNYLERFLSNAPKWILESLQVVRKEEDTVFIEENTKVTQVFILLDGIVRAMDYRMQGTAYSYMWFYPINLFGSMEVLMKMDEYRTTLKTVTPCTMLMISKSEYEAWIWEDKNALKMEVNSMGRDLLEQGRKNRVFLFLQGTDRIMFLLVQIYEESSAVKQCTISMTRQELAERARVSIKTVNRAVKKMEEDGFISRNGWKIILSEEQYEKIKAYLAPQVDLI